MYFELGDKFPNKLGEKELRKGTYTIGLTTCPWHAFQNAKLIFGVDSSYAQIDEGLKIFKNKQLKEIQFVASNHEASLIFSDGLIVRVHYSDSRDEWDILTPTNEVVINKDHIVISPAETSN